MNEPHPVKSYDTVTIEVKLKRPTWGSLYSPHLLQQQLDDEIDEVQSYLSHHPNVSQVSVAVKHWTCPVCNRYWSDGSWAANKRSAALCCYEGDI